jgi:class 3 adenylate cyclase/tetratricopeptide (TPR) repeat protein
MAVKKTTDDARRTGRMEEILLERERLDQVIKDRFRKKVTILFSDLCGYTQYTEKKGDIQGRALLLKHNRLVMPAIEAYRGNILEVIGDGVMAVFDDAATAARAAIEIQKNLEHHNRQASGEDEIHVKIGINSGVALMDESAAYQSLTGDVANVAARIQCQAAQDQILLSRSAYEETRGCSDLITRFRGNIRVKGKADDLPIYALVWKKGSDGPDSQAVLRTHPQNFTAPPGPAAVIINLEFNLEGEQLKISAHEARPGEEITMRRYETTAISMANIEQRCHQLVETLNKANRRGRVTHQVLTKLRDIGQIMYDELLTFNVKEALRNSSSENLIITIDDQLIHIPWELLHDGNQFLCLRFNMGRVVRTRQPISGAHRRKLEQPLDMLILADPTGDLKGAYTEGIQIRDFMDQSPELIRTTLRSSDATSESITIKLRNYDLIHFAGHSDYDLLHPQNSGWRLQGGLLKTDDIIRMAGSAGMPAMVFANACQSARTERWNLQESFEKKIFGMANAFLVAGVKHYIGTFWEVPDEPSSRFAIEFYNCLFGDLSVGEALRKARQALIALYGEETIVWASYVLYGDPTFDYMHQSRMLIPPAHETVPTDYLHPPAGDRTREEVIDFSESHRERKRAAWWKIALAAALAVTIGISGYNWYRGKTIRTLEHDAMAHYLTGEFDMAMGLCRQLQASAPGRPISNIILGKICLSRGDKDTARSFFLSAANSGTDSNTLKSEALLGLGRLASIDNQPREALDFYQRAARLDPHNAQPLVAQAALAENQGRASEALGLYTEALQRAPDDRGLQLAARNLQERLAWEQDQAKQERIDRLVNELTEGLGPAAPSADQETAWTSAPLSLWLMPLDESGVALQEGYGRMLHHLLGDQLAANPRFKLVERALLDRLLAELRLSASHLTDGATALSIGRLMAARIILTGHLQYDADQMVLSVRAIECETGLIRTSLVETYTSTRPSAEIAGEAAARITQALKTEFPLHARVSDVNDAEIVIDIGKTHGLQEGQLFEGVDGKVLVQISSVETTNSRAKVIRGEKLIADGLKLIERQTDER